MNAKTNRKTSYQCFRNRMKTKLTHTNILGPVQFKTTTHNDSSFENPFASLDQSNRRKTKHQTEQKNGNQNEPSLVNQVIVIEYIEYKALVNNRDKGKKLHLFKL